MKQYDEAEQAYKNGYEQGVKDFAERLKGCLLERDDDTINSIVRKLIDKQKKEDENVK